MKQIKFVILGSSLVALLALFALPFLNLGDGVSLSLWKLRGLDPSMSLPHPWGALVAGGLLALLSGVAVLRGSFGRAAAILSVVLSGIGGLMVVTLFARTRTSLGDDGGVGAKVMLAAFVVSGACALAGSIKVDRRALVARTA